MQQGSAHLHNKLLESASDSYPAYSRGSFEVAPGQVDGSKATAPGWQDVKGIWKGTVGAYGGGGGVSNFKFDITGWDWQYPFEQRSYKLDKVSVVSCKPCNLLLCKVCKLKFHETR